MAFHIEYNSDITKYKGDVIINSVGVKSTVYGGICGSIVKASGSKELKQIIDGVNDLYTVGEFFITEGYALPAKNILHLITPDFKTDPDCSKFKECIRRVLNECRRWHWRKIGIPSIGTVANHYNKDTVRTIIKEMCSAYCDIIAKDGGKEMDITLVLPTAAISHENDVRLVRESYSESEYHDPETIKKFEKGGKDLDNTIDKRKSSGPYNKTYFDYGRYSTSGDDVKLKLQDIKTIGDYVEKYIEEKIGKDFLAPSKKKMKNKVNLYLAAGKKGKKDYVHAGSDAFGEIKYKAEAEKKQLLKIILALRMTETEAETFLKHFGYCFADSGVNELDDAVKQLISVRQYGLVEAQLKAPYLFKKGH